MPDVLDQLRRYGDALEALEAPPIGVAPPHRPRRLGVAAACIALVAGAVGLVSLNRDRARVDESLLPDAYVGVNADPPAWMDKTWFTASVQPGFPDGTPTRFDVGDPDRPRLTIEAGRVVVRTPCAAAAAPVSFGTVPATEIDAARTRIDVEGAWSHQGCDLPAGLMRLLDSRTIAASGSPLYRDMSLLLDGSTEVVLGEILHPDPDAQYVLEPLLDMTRNLDVIRTIDHLRDALPNDRWDYQGEVITPSHVVAIGRVVDAEVIERSEIGDMGLDDERYLKLRFEVERSYGDPVQDTVPVGFLTRGADAERMIDGFKALGRIVLFLDRDSAVYDFDTALYAIGDNGAQIMTIQEHGTLELPAYDHALADPYLEGIETISLLVAELTKPMQDHGVLDPLGGSGS